LATPTIKPVLAIKITLPPEINF